MPDGHVEPNVVSTQTIGIPNPYRILIRDNLARLISPGVAKIYDDACRLMDINPPFSTKTHIVGHLLREVESSLRAVLQPLTSIAEELCEECDEPISSDKCKCGRPKGLQSNKNKINLILQSLGADDHLKRSWLAITRKHHKYAHRNGLDHPRPADTEFQEYWTEMEAVLVGILNQFETRYSVVFDGLDALVQKPNPTSVDATALCSNFPNNQMAREYFFSNLKNPAWLPILKEKDLFKKIPDAIIREDGGFYYPTWSPAVYLQRMAPMEPSKIVEILLEVEDTENRVAKDALLNITNELPETQRISLLSSLIKWI